MTKTVQMTSDDISHDDAMAFARALFWAENTVRAEPLEGDEYTEAFQDQKNDLIRVARRTIVQLHARGYVVKQA